jgi:hypothetical protein
MNLRPLEAKLLLLVGKEAITLVNKRPKRIEVALRRLVVLTLALLTGEQKKKEKKRPPNPL